jgi:HSP20 family protein
MQRLQRDINELFTFPDTFTNRGIFDRSTSPPLDLVESDDGYTVLCDLPGMDQKDLELSVTSNVLTIKGERKSGNKGKDTKVYKNETWEGSFQRTLSIPSPINADKIDAELSNGVLRVFLPKREEDKPKQIELKVK